MHPGFTRVLRPGIAAIGGIVNLVFIASFGVWAPWAESELKSSFLLYLALVSFCVMSFLCLWAFHRLCDSPKMSDEW